MLDLKTEFPIMYVHARPTYKLNVPAYEITANNMQDLVLMENVPKHCCYYVLRFELPLMVGKEVIEVNLV